jgi:hypothetical protein
MLCNTAPPCARGVRGELTLECPVPRATHSHSAASLCDRLPRFFTEGLILYPGSGHPVLTHGRGRRGFRLGSILGGFAVSMTDERGNAVTKVTVIGRRPRGAGPLAADARLKGPERLFGAACLPSAFPHRTGVFSDERRPARPSTECTNSGSNDATGGLRLLAWPPPRWA